MTLYQVSKYWDTIDARDYERITERFAFRANGMRDALITTTGSMHVTREAAVKAKIAQLHDDLSRAEKNLIRASKRLERFYETEGLA